MITRYIKGNILDTELTNIAHGVNCQNVMGSGVALAISKKYPNVKSEYHKFPNKYLGLIQAILTEDGKQVINCFTQDHYLPRNVRNVNYAAVMKCFNAMINHGIRKVAIPKIGCGLAGGNWEFMEQLINDVTKNDLEVWVYEY